jgi:hypothetical protein
MKGAAIGVGVAVGTGVTIWVMLKLAGEGALVFALAP